MDERRPIGDVLTTAVVPVSQTAGFEEAVNEPVSNEIHHRPVVADEGKLAGIGTTTDHGPVGTPTPHTRFGLAPKRVTDGGR